MFRGVYYAEFELDQTNDQIVPRLSEIGKEINLMPYESSLPNFTNMLFEALFSERPRELPLIDLNRVWMLLVD